MPCHPLMCCRAADCQDLNCEGHPLGAAAQLNALETRNGGMSVDFAGPEPEDDMSPTAKAIVQTLCIAVALVALCTVAANAIF